MIFNLIPDNDPENCASINCCEVDKFVVNKSFQDLKLVATEPPSYSSNSKLGPFKFVTGSGICLGMIDIESNIGLITSSDIQTLAFSPYFAGNGLYNLITSSGVSELRSNRTLIIWYVSLNPKFNKNEFFL